MYDPYNPYYGYNMSPTPTTPVRSYNMTVPVVSGRAGAEAFRMEANSSIFLMDDSGEMVWFVMTDGAGYKKTVLPCDIKPHQDQEQVKMDSIESRLSRLEGFMNELTGDTGTSEATKSTSD